MSKQLASDAQAKSDDFDHTPAKETAAELRTRQDEWHTRDLKRRREQEDKWDAENAADDAFIVDLIDTLAHEVVPGGVRKLLKRDWGIRGAKATCMMVAIRALRKRNGHLFEKE